MVDPSVKLMSSREMFAAAARATADMNYLERRLERMREAEGVRGASLAPSHGGTRDVNGMARVDARIDLEAATRERIDADRELVGFAMGVLFGADGRGGLASLMGMQTADLLRLHYLLGAPWEAAAAQVGWCLRTAYRKREAALDLVDMWGFELVAEGQGAATA